MTSDGLLVEGEDIRRSVEGLKESRGNSREKAQKETRLRTACLRRDEEDVRWLPKGCLAKPRLSGSVLAKACLVAAATYLRFATVSVGRVSDLFA